MQGKTETSSVAKTQETDANEKEHLLGLEIKEAQRVVNAVFKNLMFKLLIGALNSSNGSISRVENVLITSINSSAAYAIKTCY